MSASTVSWQEARRRAHEAGGRRAPETVALEDAVGRVLADDLVALMAVPHYASSAMDGWAVAGDGPWRILERRAEGPDEREREDVAQSVLRAGEAVPIVTGAVIPPGTRGVLRSEHGVLAPAGDETGQAVGTGPARLSVGPDGATGEPREGLHIRPAGTEAAAGETVFRAGAVLSPVHVAVAAGCGHDALEVVSRPRVTLVLTGGEVVERGIPGPGSVRDSFGPTLPAVLAGLGAEVVARHRVGDDFGATLAVFAAVPLRGSHETGDGTPGALLPEAATPPGGRTGLPGIRYTAPGLTERSIADVPGPVAELIVTTGGTGDSSADHVRPALRAAGAEFLVDGVAVRPGAPALLARLPDGRLVIGLPGNPLAAMLALLTLAHPLLSAMQGRGMPELGRVRMAEALPAGKAPTTLRPYRLVAGQAHPTAWHGAGMLRGLAEADGVLVVPQDGAAAGAELEVLRLPW
ncbi:molybdopterin molybdotransferase MoeA [Herbiconiux ginsengi]|uniref:Molybdopterin molybdenumtransferase n=1 Tax=Herbiconiux ginsengi TaxID=381665 RepID=A0A1H3KBQ3_9MICO|nr:molybdopterin molybdotransferase MoeA [Herbiconiux ginsengi]SDY49657.1 molybdopterin molybdotransferase [Herbiconiux ginsengi]